MASKPFQNARDAGGFPHSGSDEWVRQPYGVGLGTSFSTYKEELKYQLGLMTGDESKSGEGNPNTADAEALMNEQKGDNGDLQFNIPTVGDSSIFGNDVINPYAGFCRDDDIVHQSYAKEKSDKTNQYVYGMGRVYAEVYDSKQQVMYMQFGIPKYRNLRTFLWNSTDADMVDLNDNGNPSVVGKLGDFISNGIITAIKLPWLPLEWGYKAISGLNETKVTEYFYFKEQMLLYWRSVNGILAQMAVAMGLYGTDSKQDNLPELLKNGPDIFSILSKRSERFNAVKIEEQTTSAANLKKALLEDPPTEENAKGFLAKAGEWFSSFWSKTMIGVKTSILDSNKFLAFRIEKGSDNASENFSNSVQQSSLQRRLNGLVDQHRDVSYGQDTSGNDLFSWVNRQSAKAKQIKDAFVRAISSGTGGVKQIIEFAATGNGFFDLPQQWCGSSFSRSVTVNLRLRSKTGADPLSIYTSIFVPLSCLLAGAMPRQSGDSTYTSPFICRCWCRGMFAVPAGIIQSLSITRGDSEFGWSLTRLPTTVSVSMQIADLSPIMFLGLAGEGAWQQAWTNNTKLQEYLNTLAGIGLKQRYYLTQQLKRNLKVWALIHKSTTLSGAYWGMRAGDSYLGRTISQFVPVRAMRVGSN